MRVSRQSILVVEDDPNDFLLLQRKLRQTRLRRPVQLMESGERLLEYLEAAPPFEDRKAHPPPGFVFLDLKLPGMSGFEVLSWIRQRPKFKNLLVVVLTGSPLTIDNYRAFELGANGYLVKPVTTESLSNLAASLDVPWLAPRSIAGAKRSSRTVALSPGGNVSAPAKR